jgi:hypothetical protein
VIAKGSTLGKRDPCAICMRAGKKMKMAAGGKKAADKWGKG